MNANNDTRFTHSCAARKRLRILTALAVVLASFTIIALHRDNVLETNQAIIKLIWQLLYPASFLGIAYFLFLVVPRTNNPKIRSLPFTKTTKIVKYPIYAFITLLTAATPPLLAGRTVELAMDRLNSEAFSARAHVKEVRPTTRHRRAMCTETVVITYPPNKNAKLCSKRRSWLPKLRVNGLIIEGSVVELIGRSGSGGIVIDEIRNPS